MKISYLAIALSGLALAIGCSKNETSSAVGPTSLASLPKATGEVTSGSAIHRSSRNGDLQAATTGVVLKDADTSTFAGKSQAFCETASITKNLIREASQNDKVACYVGAMELGGAFSNSYDGSYHYYTLTGAGRPEGGPMRIKFKAVKDAAGAITTFEMFNCQGTSQSEYLGTTIAGGTATLTAVSNHTGTHEGNTFTGANRIAVSGTYGSSGWTGNKTIIGQGTHGGSGSFGGHSQSTYVEMTQGVSTVTLAGSSSHTFTPTSGSAFSGSGLVYAIIQGLGMGEADTFALGDGTAKATFTHDGTPHSGTVSWNGDTGANLSDVTTGDNYVAVNAATLPSSTTPSPGFTSAETWNCAAEGDFTAIDFTSLQGNAAFVAAFTACDAEFGFGDGNDAFIQCPHP